MAKVFRELTVHLSLSLPVCLLLYTDNPCPTSTSENLISRYENYDCDLKILNACNQGVLAQNYHISLITYFKPFSHSLDAHLDSLSGIVCSWPKHCHVPVSPLLFVRVSFSLFPILVFSCSLSSLIFHSLRSLNIRVSSRVHRRAARTKDESAKKVRGERLFLFRVNNFFFYFYAIC